jgi:hypothetical protein
MKGTSGSSDSEIGKKFFNVGKRDSPHRDEVVIDHDNGDRRMLFFNELLYVIRYPVIEEGEPEADAIAEFLFQGLSQSYTGLLEPSLRVAFFQSTGTVIIAWKGAAIIISITIYFNCYGHIHAVSWGGEAHIGDDCGSRGLLPTYIPGYWGEYYLLPLFRASFPCTHVSLKMG